VDVSLIWIGDPDPTIDAIGISLTNDSHAHAKLPLTTSEIESNTKEGAIGAIFSYTGKVERGSSAGEVLVDALAGEKLEFQLLSSGRAVSTTRDVKFFELPEGKAIR